ncbi:hypothetical protein PCK2_000445 [Pneumocystis canis]|nr:hypothetical protein PCK2_000445 [Pneumocystis canis]
MSVNAIVHPYSSENKTMELPLVRGMAYITAIYTNLTPLFTSVVGFRNIQKISSQEHKYSEYLVTLYDGKYWLLYAFPNPETSSFDLEIQDGMLKATTGIFNGIIQVTKIPVNNPDAQTVLDASAGTYPKTITLSAYVNGTSGSYAFTFDVSTYDHRPLLHYALYHHMTSFDSDTSSRKTNVSLPSPTNGLMVAYTGSVWTMIEMDLPVDISFSPYSDHKHAEYSEKALEDIRTAAMYEISQSVEAQIDKNSVYFSGKVFSKIALLCWVIKTILKDQNLTQICLEKFKDSFMPFVKNENPYQLVYETTWKGIVSNQGFKVGPHADFGSSYYNDHHFHYGYFVFAGAVIGSIDPSWLYENKDWFIGLIRDVSNPVNDESI